MSSDKYLKALRHHVIVRQAENKACYKTIGVMDVYNKVVKNGYFVIKDANANISDAVVDFQHAADYAAINMLEKGDMYSSHTRVHDYELLAPLIPYNFNNFYYGSSYSASDIKPAQLVSDKRNKAMLKYMEFGGVTELVVKDSFDWNALSPQRKIHCKKIYRDFGPQGGGNLIVSSVPELPKHFSGTTSHHRFRDNTSIYFSILAPHAFRDGPQEWAVWLSRSDRVEEEDPAVKRFQEFDSFLTENQTFNASPF